MLSRQKILETGRNMLGCGIECLRLKGSKTEGQIPKTVAEGRATIRFGSLFYFLGTSSVECLLCAVHSCKSYFRDLSYYLVLTTSPSHFLLSSPFCK